MYFAIIMKRIIVSSIIALIVLILAAGGYYYSQKYAVIHSNPIDAIPTDAAWIIELKNCADGNQQLSKTDFFKTLQTDSSFALMKKSVYWLDSVSKTDDLALNLWTQQKIFISAHPTKATDFDLLYTCNLPRGKSAGDIISIIEDLIDPVFKKEEREYEDVKIHELSRNNESVFTYAISKGVFIFSRTSFLVEDAIRQLKSGISFNKTKSFTKTGTKFGTDESVLLFVNNYGLHDMLSGYIGSEREGFLESINNICRWSRFSFRLEKNTVIFNGISSSHDTTDLFSSIRNQTTSISHSASVVPARTAFLFNVSVANIDQCLDKLRANGKFFTSQESIRSYVDSIDKKHKFNLRQLMTNWNKKEIALAITEPGSMSLENNTYALIRTENTADAIKSLEKIQVAAGKLKGNEKYRSHTISNINLNSIVPLFYGNLFIDIQQTYFTVVKDFVVFANSPTVLKSLIDDFEDKKVLDKETDYLSHLTRSVLTSQINVYFNLQKGTNILRSLSNEDISPKLINDGVYKKMVQSLAISFTTKNDMTISTGRIDFSGKISKEIHLLWSSQLDTTPATPPFVIVNGENKYIAIQDNDMNLNFYNEAGRLMWKKYLGEKIMSKIYFMDQYNNGECQLVFNTTNKLYLVTTKGDSISNFPIRLPAPASNGCLVKDFDGFNKYEIYVACQNGTIYAYEPSGKPLAQWITKQTVYGVDQPFIPFRYNNTDYIYAYGDHNQYIADRKGKIVKLKSPENAISKTMMAYSDSGKTCTFYILDNSGRIYSVDPAQTGELKALNLPDTISDITTQGDLLNNKIVMLSNNTLYNFSTTGELVKASELEPDGKFKFVNPLNVDYKAGITDLNHNKFYLLSPISTVEDGYPVWGNSDFSIMKGSENNSRSLIVISDSNGVLYVYGE